MSSGDRDRGGERRTLSRPIDEAWLITAATSAHRLGQDDLTHIGAWRARAPAPPGSAPWARAWMPPRNISARVGVLKSPKLEDRGGERGHRVEEPGKAVVRKDEKSWSAAARPEESHRPQRRAQQARWDLQPAQTPKPARSPPMSTNASAGRRARRYATSRAEEFPAAVPDRESGRWCTRSSPSPRGGSTQPRRRKARVRGCATARRSSSRGGPLLHDPPWSMNAPGPPRPGRTASRG